MKKPVRFIGGRKTRHGTIFPTSIIGHGEQGVITKTEYTRRKHKIELAEKTYFEQVRKKSWKTNAIQDYRTFRRLKKILPKELFLPTIRLKIEKGKKPTLVMTQLGKNRKKVLDLKNLSAWQLSGAIVSGKQVKQYPFSRVKNLWN